MTRAVLLRVIAGKVAEANASNLAHQNGNCEGNSMITYLSKKCPSQEQGYMLAGKPCKLKLKVMFASLAILYKMPFTLYLGISKVAYHRMLDVEGLEVVKCAKCWTR